MGKCLEAPVTTNEMVPVPITIVSTSSIPEHDIGKCLGVFITSNAAVEEEAEYDCHNREAQ